jgi:hypothetical protein
MAKEWIEKLAAEIKEKDLEPAEKLAREKYVDNIITVKGRAFYDQLVETLVADIQELKASFEGTSLAIPITVQRQPTVVSVKRDNFPRVEAKVHYTKEAISLNYAAPPQLSPAYRFHVGEGEGISVRETFGENAKHFNHPAELAKHIMELLFKV